MAGWVLAPGTLATHKHVGRAPTLNANSSPTGAWMVADHTWPSPHFSSSPLSCCQRPSTSWLPTSFRDSPKSTCSLQPGQVVVLDGCTQQHAAAALARNFNPDNSRDPAAVLPLIQLLGPLPNPLCGALVCVAQPWFVLRMNMVPHEQSSCAPS
jgi:hypothetical protein